MYKLFAKRAYQNLFKSYFKYISKTEKLLKKNIKNEPVRKQLLYLGIRRFNSHAKALIILCRKEYNVEALMLLRPIIELVVNLRWVLEDNSDKNLQTFLANVDYVFENGIPKMGGYWSEQDLLGRMKDIGFGEKYYKSVVKKLHEELHGNPAIIARAHRKNLTSMSSEAIFSVACQFLGHLLKVINSVFPEARVPDHSNIWNKIKIA